MKLTVTNTTVAHSKTGILVGHGSGVSEVVADANVFDHVDKAIHIEGAPSVAAKLGIPDIPPAELERFVALVKASTPVEEAAKKSGVLDYLKEHGIEIGIFVASVIALFKGP